MSCPSDARIRRPARHSPGSTFPRLDRFHHKICPVAPEEEAGVSPRTAQRQIGYTVSVRASWGDSTGIASPPAVWVVYDAGAGPQVPVPDGSSNEAYAMSARGWLVTSPGTRRSKLVSESKRYIPLFWLSFLSSEDITNAEHVGQFKLDRKRAIEHGLDALPFLSALFPQVPTFGEIANHLVEKLHASRSPTIGIEVIELLCEDDYGGALPTI